MQRVAMMVRVAAGIIKGVPPADEAEHIEEDLVQPFGLEDGAMPQLMGRGAGEEAGHRAMAEERNNKAQPELVPPKAEDDARLSTRTKQNGHRPGTRLGRRCGAKARAIGRVSWRSDTNPPSASSALQREVGKS